MDIAEYAVKVRFMINKTLKGKLVQVQHGPATVIGRSSYISTVQIKGWEGEEDC